MTTFNFTSDGVFTQRHMLALPTKAGLLPVGFGHARLAPQNHQLGCLPPGAKWLSQSSVQSFQQVCPFTFEV